MNSYKKKLARILDNNYSVRSGVYTAIDPKIKMKMDAYGEYQPILRGDETEDTCRKLLSVDMMSEESPSEDDISHELYSKVKNIKYDPVLGYYTGLYAGYVAESDFRKEGSSGGFTSWILAELYKQKKIDNVIRFLIIETVRENTLYGAKFVSDKEAKREKRESEKTEAKEPINEVELDKTIDSLVV